MHGGKECSWRLGVSIKLENSVNFKQGRMVRMTNGNKRVIWKLLNFQLNKAFSHRFRKFWREKQMELQWNWYTSQDCPFLLESLKKSRKFKPEFFFKKNVAPDSFPLSRLWDKQREVQCACKWPCIPFCNLRSQEGVEFISLGQWNHNGMIGPLSCNQLPNSYSLACDCIVWWLRIWLFLRIVPWRRSCWQFP